MGADAYVALPRGINLGGGKKLPMKDLAARFEAAGRGEAPCRFPVDRGLAPRAP